MTDSKTTALSTISINAGAMAPKNFDEVWRFAQLVAGSDLAPKQFKGKAGDVLIAMQMGAELGLAPMQALHGIAVINGRPSIWGDAMMALVRSHPECEGIEETITGDATEGAVATCIARRKGQGEVKRTFSVGDAKRAGLWGKEGPWRSYPQRMLQMRARSWALRDMFADALRGIDCAEEVADVAPQPGPQVVESGTVSFGRRAQAALPAATVDAMSDASKAAMQQVADAAVRHIENKAADSLASILAGYEVAESNDELTALWERAGRTLSDADKPAVSAAHRAAVKRIREAAENAGPDGDPGPAALDESFANEPGSNG